MKKSIVHPAHSRGHRYFGWLNAYYSFNIAGFTHPTRNPFGTLLVLNEDTIAPNTGFGMHPHKNMEIISIPLHGTIIHKDTTGKEIILSKDDFQIMTAGTGIYHSEFNFDNEAELNLLQIWIAPNRKNVEPSHQQLTFATQEREDKLVEIVSPYKKNGTLLIQQQAWISIGNFTKENTIIYTIKQKNNGAYIFVIKGSLTIDETTLTTKDAMGIWDTQKIIINVEEDAEFIIIDVPMQSS